MLQNHYYTCRSEWRVECARFNCLSGTGPWVQIGSCFTEWKIHCISNIAKKGEVKTLQAKLQEHLALHRKGQVDDNSNV